MHGPSAAPGSSGGLGIFARRDLEAGATVAFLNGKRYTDQEMEKRCEEKWTMDIRHREKQYIFPNYFRSKKCELDSSLDSSTRRRCVRHRFRLSADDPVVYDLPEGLDRPEKYSATVGKRIDLQFYTKSISLDRKQIIFKWMSTD